MKLGIWPLYRTKVPDEAWKREDPARWKDKFRVVAKECFKIPKVGDLGQPWTWRTLVIASLWVGISVRFLFAGRWQMSLMCRPADSMPARAGKERANSAKVCNSQHLEVKEDQRFKGAGPLSSFCLSLDSAILYRPGRGAL